MCTYDYVDLPGLHPLDDLLRLRVGEEPRKHLDTDGVVREPLAEVLEVLLREQRGRNEHGGLHAVLYGLEDGPDGDFGLAVADIAADETIHRRRCLHVRLHVLDRLQLIRRLHIGEQLLHLPLPRRVLPERMAGRSDARLVEDDELLRDFAHRGAHLRLRRAELLAAEAVQRRRLARVWPDGVDLVARDVELVVAAELEQQVVALSAADGPLHHAREAADAVDVVHHMVAGLEVVEEGLRLATALGPGLAVRPPTSRHIGLRKHSELHRREDEAALDRLHDDLHPGGGALVDVSVVARRHHRHLETLVAQHHLKPIGRSLGVGREDHAVAIAQEVPQLRDEARRVAHHRGPAHRLDHRRRRALRSRRHRPCRCTRVREQPVEREVQPWERSRVSQHRAGPIGAPSDGERVGQRSLFVEQIGSPITHAAGLHQHDQCVGRDQVHEHVFALSEPRQPGLHAVEHETLREAFPLVAAPRLGRHHRLGAGPHLRRRPQLTAAEQLDLGDVDGRTLILHAELAEPVDLVSPEVDTDRNLRGRWEDVDDRAADGDLTAVLDLVLPPVAEPDQLFDQGLGVELLARAHDDRCGLLDMRAQALQHGLHRDHQCGRHALLRP